MKDSHLPKAILRATERAVKAAQLEHHSELMPALKERGQLIAELFGLDPVNPLPASHPKTIPARTKQIAGRNRETIDRIKELDILLFKALDAQFDRMRVQQSDIHRAGRFAEGARSTILREKRHRIDIHG